MAGWSKEDLGKIEDAMVSEASPVPFNLNEKEELRESHFKCFRCWICGLYARCLLT